MSSRLRKKAFHSLLSLSVISPRGGELKEGSQFNRRVWKDVSLRNWFFRTLLDRLITENGRAMR